MSEKKKTIEFLTNQIALKSIIIEKTEKLLKDMKGEMAKDIRTYESVMKSDEKSMEQLVTGCKKHG